MTETRKLTIMDITIHLDKEINSAKLSGNTGKAYELGKVKKWIQDKYQKGIEV